MPNKKFFIVILLLVLLSACAPQTPPIPQTEAEVPRVTVEEAKSALDGGKAVLVDVRSLQAYEKGHAVGAIPIPLTVFETDIASLPLEKDQWVITYCS